jgi:hypothetical protein
MKHLKISIVAVVAIVMGIAASAFTSKKIVKDEAPETMTWFQFTGSDPTNVAQVQNYLNYSYTDGQPCSGLTNKICAVEANGVASPGQHPSSAFSSTLKSELQDVIDNGSTYPDITQRVQ